MTNERLTDLTNAEKKALKAVIDGNPQDAPFKGSKSEFIGMMIHNNISSNLAGKIQCELEHILREQAPELFGTAVAPGLRYEYMSWVGKTSTWAERLVTDIESGPGLAVIDIDGKHMRTLVTGKTLESQTITAKVRNIRPGVS